MMLFGISDFGRMLSVGAIRFEDGLCTSRKGGTKGSGWVYPSGWQCMTAVAADCRKALFCSLKVYTLKKFATTHCTAKFFHCTSCGTAWPLHFQFASYTYVVWLFVLLWCCQGNLIILMSLGDSAWQLLQLAVENPSQRRVGQLSAFLHKWA